MSRRKTQMKKITEILWLRSECGWSYQGIGATLNISETAAHRLAVRAKDAGIGWPLPDGVDEDRLEQMLYRSWQPETDAQFDFEWVSREMERKGVTLKLLWQELRDQGYPHSYSWFCRRCQQWERRTCRTMRMRYKLGEAVFVDYTRATATVSGRKAQTFVGALGVSHYIHAEASWTQKVDDIGFFENNRHRMRYGEYRAQGLCVKRRDQGRLQECHRCQTETFRNALECAGRQRYPCSAMLCPEPAL